MAHRGRQGDDRQKHEAGPDHHALDTGAVACAVITVSDTRTPATDKSGDTIQRLLEAAGHRVVERRIVADEVGGIRRGVLEAVDDDAIEVIVLTGGTGVGQRDVTPFAVEPMFRKALPGFGERFRQISYDEIGPMALLSQATAGIIGHTAVFALPGSPAACQTAVEKLIVPSLAHLVGLLRYR